MTAQIVGEEFTTIRSGKVYQVWGGEPTSGTWWAVQVVPVQFPDTNYFLTTPDGAQVEQACIIACQRRPEDGKWQWCHLPPTTKRLFGDLLFAANIRGVWAYIIEE